MVCLRAVIRGIAGLNESDAIEEVERQKLLSHFLKGSGGNWSRLERILQQLDNDGILIGRFMSQCPDCAGSNLELSAAKRLESGKTMAGVCFYQDPLESTSEKLYLRYFSLEHNSVYGGANHLVNSGEGHLALRRTLVELLTCYEFEFELNEEFDGFEISGPWNFDSQDIYSQDSGDYLQKDRD